MNHWMWPVSLVGILSTAIFFTIGVPLSDWFHHLPEPKSWVFCTCSPTRGSMA